MTAYMSDLIELVVVSQEQRSSQQDVVNISEKTTP